MSKKMRASADAVESARAHRVAVMTAAGTLLVGVAAVGALFINRSSGSTSQESADATGERTSEVPPSSPSDAPAELAELNDLVGLRSGFDSFAKANLRAVGEPLSGEFRSVSSEYSLVSADLPDEWSDVQLQNWEADEADYPVGTAIFAGIDAADLGSTPDAPGVFLGVSSIDLPPDVLMGFSQEKRLRTCDRGGVGDFDGTDFEGLYAWWSGCGDGAVVLDLAVLNRETNASLVVFIRLADQSELPAAAQILNTLSINAAALEEFRIEDTSWKRPGWYRD